MESTLVIKVNYGDTLRRLSACVDENNQLNLDMVGLRAKICSLFNFTADANLMLRYVDEDGDLVTLVDDDDLHDVMSQRLKLLRIHVYMSNDSGGKSNAGSNGSATPLRSPLVPNPIISGHLAKLGALKSSGSATPLGSPLVPNPILSGHFALVDALKSSGSATPIRSPMESALVIKVKYGDTLRRFSARVDENNQLDLDMVGLRAKICSLLNFTVDANLMLRYVDEDGDLVTLVDDDDLHDVMRQRLKFLRIDVHMSNDSGVRSNAGSSGSATPLRSPLVPNPILSGHFVDALKSVPQPLHEALSNLSLDLVSKAASSSPVLANLADSISKVGHSILNSHCQPHVVAGPSSKNGVPGVHVTSEARGPQSTNVDSTSNASQQVEAGNATRGVVAGVAPVDLNILPCDPYSSESTNVNTAPLSSAVPDGDGKKGKTPTDDNFVGKGESSGTSSSSAAPNNCSTQATAMSSSAFIKCPIYTLDSVPPSSGNYHIHPFKRSHRHVQLLPSGMFHKGVRCDGCGVYPITGPRFKSEVKENYDLCSICFNKMGNATDYMRIDRPVSVHAAPQCFKGVYEHPPWTGAPTIPHIFKTGSILKHARPKLDSRFILDVNVIDGTMMAPSTAFTKIWRMRNNGTLVWPQGTQLVWIGGDKFSDSHSVDLEVPEDGVSSDKELDIAVDFRAPQLPGRYISYWRMASPSGQKFGQRVWVLIQVDASLRDSFYDNSQGLNLNIPLDVSGSKGPQIIDINVQPIEDDAFLQPHNPSAPTEPVNQMVDKQPRPELENEFSINEATFVGPAASLPATSAAPSSVSYPIIDFSETAPAVLSSQQSSAVDAPSSVSYPIIDFSETAPAVLSSQQSSAVDAPSSSLGIGGNDSVEETLLKELEEMGFKQVDLNKEILRMNEYNLEQSVDDLCGVLEWDPILEELQEMGFRDNEMNKRLLMKNNGSIKRVVMDLINKEQQV